MAQELSNLADRNQGIAVNWAGEWQSGKVYYTNQAVFHPPTSSSYRANKKTTAVPSDTSNDWDLIAKGTGGSGSSSGFNPTITSPANNEVLAYDSTSSLWINKTPAEAGLALAASLSSHTSNTSNPHSVTAAQVGAIPTSEKGTALGVATLDAGGTIPDTQIPSSIARDTELGNATSIRGKLISTTAPTNGQVLTYASATDDWRPITPSGGGGSGIVLQMKSAVSSGSTTISGSNQSTGLAITITPISATSILLFQGSLAGILKTGSSDTNYLNALQLFDGTNTFAISNLNAGRFTTTYIPDIPINRIISQGNTNTITYTLRISRVGTGDITLNSGVSSISILTVMEIQS